MIQSKEQLLRDAVADVLIEDPAALSMDENLFEAGLDSIGLLRLVNRLRRDGLQADFAELAQAPTLAAWTALLAPRTPTGTTPAASIADGAPTTGAVAAMVEGEPAPLGVMQHAYWVGRSPGQRLGGVAAHLYVEFDHPATGGCPAIDPDRLRSALERLVERHETLRTRTTDDGGQAELPALSPSFAVHDLTGSADGEVAAHLESMRDGFSHQILDLEKGEVFRAALSLLPGGATRLHLDVDMIAADAVSYRLLLADLAELYIAPGASLPPLGLKYRDHLASAKAEASDRVQQAAAAWAHRLDQLPGPPALPEVVISEEGAAKPRVARRHMWLPPERKQALTDAARGNGVTVAMAVATLLAEMIGNWSATDHFLLNVPMFDRPANHPDIDRIVGDFSSSVMLEVDLRQPLAFADRVRALQQRMHADAAHAAYTGLDVLRDLGRLRGETVLAPVVFTSALGLGELFPPAVTEVVGRPVWVISQGPQVLLDAQVTEFESGLLVNWDTREEALPPGMADAMFALFEATMQKVIDAPETWRRPLDLSSPDEPERRLDGRAVRIVDQQDRDRPAYVPGLLLADGAAQADAPLWAVADCDGRVTLLGTDDDRVEVHGVPVWPVQVEAAIRSDTRVRDVGVVTSVQGIAAAVVLAPSADANPAPDGKTLRAELARRIPAHLLPARVVVLNALPYDAAGQLDAQALRKEIAAHSAEAGYLAPRSDLERVIAGVWAEVLDLERVGANEAFIALGGDSLLAARVVARLQEELDTNAVSLRTLFRSPTVAELAAQLRNDDDPARLDEVAAIVLEIRSMSDEEVAALLGEEETPARECRESEAIS